RQWRPTRHRRPGPREARWPLPLPPPPTGQPPPGGPVTDRIPAQADSPDLPEQPDYPRIVAVFNEATGPLRARDVWRALDHELRPKNIEGTHAKLKRLVKLDSLAEVDAGSFIGKQ
ncbi:hypothetical protein ACGFZK_36425, partial [Streptomyces sp. NPDC048257]